MLLINFSFIIADKQPNKAFNVIDQALKFTDEVILPGEVI